MNRQVCKYSIICFQPYVETGELANIGIVLYVPNSKELKFKLMNPKECGRITEFFKPLKREIYTESIQIVRTELTRVQNLSIEHKTTPIGLFEELIRPREGIIQYRQNRAIYSNNLDDTIEELFEYYVRRGFAHKEAHEEEMRKRVRKLLNEHDMTNTYIEGFLGDKNKYSVCVPFVNTAKKTAIKPIHFTHPDPNKLIEHGISWRAKIQQLERYGFVQANKMMFVYRSPLTNQGVLFEAFSDVSKQIEDAGILMVPITQPDEITKTAKYLAS